MTEPTSPFHHYDALVRKVEAHAARTTAEHADQMFCKRGCTACCRQDLNVSRVEADHISKWLETRGSPLPAADDARTRVDAHPLFERLAGDRGCAFLSEGACSIYEVRPVICRTHGLPIRTDRVEVDVCPLNFDPAIGSAADVPDVHVLDLERLNLVLAAVDHAYVTQTGASPSRQALSQIRRERSVPKSR
ncbi:MAG: YkgJ family cysteine cluster protein [Nannocystaceae bacterium]